MKFRLSPGTFSELDLAKEDMDNMENVAAMIVDSAIEDFELLRLDKNGFADKRWKPIKRKAGVVLYEDRSMRENIKRESTLSEMPQPCGIHPLMAHGTTRECKICSSIVCPHCRVPLKVAWKPRDGPNMFTNEKKTAAMTRFEKALVCRPCLRKVERTDALDVAIDEIRRASPLLAAESGLAVTSASSLFSLINSDQFDRDCFFHTY
ncbi:hypothetical protein PC117_g2672 [Phytophthora cactorum]|uniref:Uncharacterized protein n=1 Tax=Phytophthora cactorum TaxID=29920 RepID=A0A8T1EG12_9STRA|nr:hypothetical protein PC117_g2672 [Phytophthora cactorum]